MAGAGSAAGWGEARRLRLGLGAAAWLGTRLGGWLGLGSAVGTEAGSAAGSAAGNTAWGDP